MKVDFSTPITNLDGSALGEGATVGAMCVNALLTSYPGDEQATGEEKVRRFKLAERAYGAGETEITPEDATFIRSFIAKGYGPLVVGQVFRALGG